MSRKYELHEVAISLKVIVASKPNEDPAEIVRQQIDEIFQTEKQNIEYESSRKISRVEELPAGYRGALPWADPEHAAFTELPCEMYLEGEGVTYEDKS